MSLMVRPISIGNSKLSSSSITDSQSAWDSTTLYAVGDKVLGSTYPLHVYEALTGNTLYTFAPGDVDYVTNDQINLSGIGNVFAPDDPIVFSSTGTLPAPLVAGTTYYYKDGATPTVNYFRVIASPGGATINLTSPGSGTHSMCLAAGANFGNDPETDDGTNWLDIGPSNKWAMFDTSNTTKSSDTSSISVALAPGSRFDAVALLGMSGASQVALYSTIAAASNNLLTYSEDLSNASWTKVQSSITTNNTDAPNGAATADKITVSSATSVHGVYHDGTVTSGATATFSVYLKAGQITKVRVSIADTGSTTNLQVAVDLSAGTLSGATVFSTPAVIEATSIEDVGDGWYRVSLTGNISGNTTYRCICYALDANGNVSFTGNGSDAWYAWGAQLEQTSAPGYYTHKTGTAQITYTAIKVFDTTDTGFTDDWYADTYAESWSKNRIGFSGIPPEASTTLNLTASGSGTVSIGTCIVGLSKDIGKAEYGASVGIDDYSLITRDSYGTTTITQRTYNDRGDFNLFLEVGKSDALLDLFTQYRATPALWLMAPDSSAWGWSGRGIIYGLPLNFKCLLRYPSHEMFSLELSGLA